MMEPLHGYDDWLTYNPWDDDVEHLKECPMHEDNHDGEPARCTCPTVQDLKDEAAERRFDAEREG